MSAGREWTVRFTEDGSTIETHIKVVAKTDFDELAAENERLNSLTKSMSAVRCGECGNTAMWNTGASIMNENSQLKAKCESLEEECRLLRVGLGFYGNRLNWEMCWRPDIEKYVPANSEGTSEIELHQMNPAKTALRKADAIRSARAEGEK